MKRKQGFTLVEIMIVVAIIALLTAIAIPAFLQYRRDAQASVCSNALRLIHHAKEVLAIKYNYTNGWAAADSAAWWTLLDPYLDSTNVLTCPLTDQSGTVHYSYNPVGTVPTCTLVASYTDHFINPND